MHSNYILDSAANLSVRRHMIFEINVQKSPIAFHLKGLDLSSSSVMGQLSQA